MTQFGMCPGCFQRAVVPGQLCLRCQRGVPKPVTGRAGMSSGIGAEPIVQGTLAIATPAPGAFQMPRLAPDAVPLFELTVYGDPAPQGSKKAVGRTKTGRTILVESSKKVDPWRTAVEKAARAALPDGWVPLEDALYVEYLLSLKKPKTFPAGDLRRIHGKPTTYPDKSKLERSTEDALTFAGVWADDARVTNGQVAKRYVGSKFALPQPGVVLRIYRDTED